MPAWPVAAFLVSLFIPWIIMVGPLSMSPTRIFLVGCTIPCLIRWASGAAGRVRAPDLLVLGYAVWCFIALVANHGFGGGVQSGGILFVETIGPYMLARLYVRDRKTFSNTIRFGALLILFMLPFSIFEWITGKKLILDTFHAIATTFEYGESEVRMGFKRVQSTFEHPILYGVFCASFFALLALDGGDEQKKKSSLLKYSTLLASILSMSSAPWASVLTQSLLVGWNKLMRSFASRWKILWGFVLLGYLVIEFGSNQTPIQFYISKFTFDQQTGWYRLFIWEFGSASVANNPIFGIGLNDWVRPSWMASTTVDNFWLLTAMRYGLPALALLVLTILTVSFGMVRRMGKDAALDQYRTGYLICMFTFAFVGSTVHFWGAVYLWYLFMLGAGVWMMDASAAEDGQSPRRASGRQSANLRRRAHEAGITRLEKEEPGRVAAGPIDRNVR